MPAVLQNIPSQLVGSPNLEILWFACGGRNPVYFTFRREDYRLFSITDSTTTPGTSKLVTTNQNILLEATVGGTIAILSQNVGFAMAKITAINAVGATVEIETDHTFSGTIDYDFLGHRPVINLITDRPGYQSIFTAYNPVTNVDISTARVSAAPNGTMLLDVAGMLAKVIKDDSLAVPSVDSSEPNSSIPFRIRYIDSAFPGSSGTIRTVPQTYYAGYFANQLQSEYGESLALNVCDVFDNGRLGKFLCPFEKPRYWPGFPFSMQFIIQEADGFSSNIVRYEDQFNILGGLLATTNASLSGSDWTKVHQLALDGTYSPGVDEIDVWLDTTFFTLPAKITGIVLVNVGSCDPATGEYTATFQVFYENVTTDTLQITVGSNASQNFAVTSSPAEVTLQGLTSDGAATTVNGKLLSDAFFSNFDAANLYTAPVGCQQCQVFSVTPINSGNVDLVNNTFDWEFQMDYANGPSPLGNVSVNGVQIAAPASGVTATVTLPLATDPIDLNLFFVNDSGCSYVRTGFITPPTLYVKRTVSELVATSNNTLPNLPSTPRPGSVTLLEYKHLTYTDSGASPSFSITGNVITWNNINAGVEIQSGDSVYIEYETYATTSPGDNWVFEAKEVVSDNVLPEFLQFTRTGQTLVMYLNGAAYREFGADAKIAVTGTAVSFTGQLDFTIKAGDTVYYKYNTLIATGNEESKIDTYSITSQNVIPSELTEEPRDTADIILFINGLAYFNFGNDAAFSINIKSIAFNSASAGFDLSPGTQVDAVYQTDV